MDATKKEAFKLNAEVFALTAKFRWGDACAQADGRVRRISVRTKNDGAIVEKSETAGNEFRIVIAPDTDYIFRIETDGEVREHEFRSAEDFGHFDDTDAVQKFGKARKGAGFYVPCEKVGIHALPEVDETQALSPWYAVKEFPADLKRKPTFAQLKNLLPEPVMCEADEYLKNAYYHAWKIALDEWLVDPPDRGQSVFFNNCCYYWNGHGSGVDYDTSFIMMYAKYAFGAFPYHRALDNLYARQHENGFIIKEGDLNNYEVYSSAPGWMAIAYVAWTEWEIYLHTGDAARIKNVFAPLVKYYEWHRTYMEKSDGSHPDVQFIHGDWAVANESAYLMYARCLQKMAALLRRDDCARYFDAQAERFIRYIENEMWDEAHGVYAVKVNGVFSIEIKPGMISKYIKLIEPLITGEARAERAAKVLAVLLDPQGFAGPYGFRSLTLDSTHYMLDADNFVTHDELREKGYCDYRRAIWPPNAVFGLRALKMYGHADEAAEMAERYVRAIAKIHADTGDIWEYSLCDELVSCGNPRFVGWSGYGPIACLIEQVLGFAADAPSNTLTFTMRRDDEHGIRKLRFGAVSADVICAAKTGADAAREINITASAPFTLRVIADGAEKCFGIPEGESRVSMIL
ncbi:MAG: hypothetical protein FWG05_01705 [Kiritimatiellaeota bacterium]|nr:hypothetical protein [Kiritimatiellota bacterium]